MNSVVYVGTDVHKESYHMCCYMFEADKIQYQQRIKADYRMMLKYLEDIIYTNP